MFPSRAEATARLAFRRRALATQPTPAVGSEMALATHPVMAFRRAVSMTPRIARREKSTNRSRSRSRSRPSPATGNAGPRSVRLAPAPPTIPAAGPTTESATAIVSMSCPARRSTTERTASLAVRKGRAEVAWRERARLSSRGRRGKSRVGTSRCVVRRQTWIEARSTRYLRCSTSTACRVDALRSCTTPRSNRRFRGTACTWHGTSSSATTPRSTS